TETATTGANSLDERALRNKVHLHLFFDHLPLRLGIEADVTGDRLADQTGIDKLADAAPGHGRVVRDDGKIALSLPNKLIDDTLWRSDTHEAADHEGRAHVDHCNGILNGDGFHVTHSRLARAFWSAGEMPL